MGSVCSMFFLQNSATEPQHPRCFAVTGMIFLPWGSFFRRSYVLLAVLRHEGASVFVIPTYFLLLTARLFISYVVYIHIYIYIYLYIHMIDFNGVA